MPAQSDPRRRPPASPEIEPPPGSPPKRFPDEPTPMAGEKKQADSGKTAKPEEAETSSRLGSGEDPSVESGTDKNDPEQQAAGGGDVEKSFE